MPPSCRSHGAPSVCWIFGLVPNGSTADQSGMAYIIERNHRFYVVDYDGIDPLTRRERRRWHPAGRSRADAEAIAATLERATTPVVPVRAASTTLGAFLAEQWMPRRRTQLEQTTAHRYGWMIDNYINPRIGDIPLRSLRVEHLDGLYHSLLTSGSRDGGPLASKTVYDVHVIVRSALADAVRRHLVDTNVALAAHAPRSTPRARRGPETWTASQLGGFLTGAAHLRLYPALHLAAYTGMRRGELAGLRWGDWHRSTHRISIARSRQVVGGRSVEMPVKTRTSRRCIDLDAGTEQVLERWRRAQGREGHPADLGDPVFTNRHGDPVHAESISQLFNRHLARTDIHASASTTWATPTQASSSPPAHPSRSSPNASATPTPASPWPPTHTSHPA